MRDETNDMIEILTVQTEATDATFETLWMVGFSNCGQNHVKYWLRTLGASLKRLHVAYILVVLLAVHFVAHRIEHLVQ